MTALRTLTTATAVVALLTTPLLANSNLLFIDQTGSGNGATVDQNFASNEIGASNAQNRVQQNGAGNSLLAVQNGGSKAGLGGSYSQHNLGIDQIGKFNEIVLTQTGSHLYSVQQAATNGALGFSNKLTLTQSGNHIATRILQTYTGNGTSTNAGNTINISQTGSIHQQSWVGLKNGQFRYDYATYFQTALTGDQAGSHQIFGGVVQNGYANEALVTQVGAHHQVASVLQLGNGNIFSSSQSGGNGNVLTFAHSVGDANDILLTQSGASNSVFSIKQNGSDNNAVVSQTGGNGNMVNRVEQDGSRNTATLTFVGSSNGAAAGSLADFAPAFQDRGLTQGDVLQANTDNSITYQVTGDSNLFAFKQDGTGNTTVGAVSGNDNSVAVLQTGISNVSNFTQNGGTNNLSVSQ